MTTAGFNSVLQLGESVVNKTLEALIESGALPTKFAGTRSFADQIPGLEIRLGYEAELANASVRFLLGRVSMVRVLGEVQAHLRLCFHLDLDGQSKELCLLDLDAGVNFEAEAELKSINSAGQTYLSIGFASLSGLEISINGVDIPEKYEEVLRRVLERVLIVEFRAKFRDVPVTALIGTRSLGGWPVTESDLRVVEKDGRTALALALQTAPNSGSGDSKGLAMFLGNADFGVAVDEALLVQALDIQWRRGQIPSRFGDGGRPDPSGRIRLKVFSFAVRESSLGVSVNVVWESGVGNQEFWIHGDVTASYGDGRFHVRVNELSVELPWAATLLGFIAFRGYFVLVALVLGQLAGKFIGDVSAELLEAFLNSEDFALLYKGPIPGSGLEAVVTLADLTISDGEVLSRGNVIVAPHGPETHRSSGRYQ